MVWKTEDKGSQAAGQGCFWDYVAQLWVPHFLHYGKQMRKLGILVGKGLNSKEPDWATALRLE